MSDVPVNTVPGTRYGTCPSCGEPMTLWAPPVQTPFQVSFSSTHAPPECDAWRANPAVMLLRPTEYLMSSQRRRYRPIRPISRAQWSWCVLA